MLTDTTESPHEIAAEAVELLRDGPPKLLARALSVHAETMRSWRADEARTAALEALEIAERNDLTSWPSSCTPPSPGSTRPAARTRAPGGARPPSGPGGPG